MKMVSRFFQIAACTLVCLLFASPLSLAGSALEVTATDTSPASDTLPKSDRWLAQDKLEHLAASAFFSGVSYSICRDFYNNRKETSVYFSASFTLGLGVGKEIYDRKKPGGRFSYKDLVADIAGIGLGLLIATR
jgi:putative lipoprotein